ncbi:MAG: hypothetical protein QG641_2142 [Candidatus Poribacteria bacterium]|nr:hypothetical protein [Candidatus Poribacteria bacterium]
MGNILYYGDNLDILRKYIPDNLVDLIYLDPPFNSKANYNILYKEPSGDFSDAQITAFEDTWHWAEKAETTFKEIMDSTPANVVDMMRAFRSFIGNNDMMAYLTMMCIRLIELKRVLKDTGSIYLHCDPTASHYLKILMDAIFDKSNFRNEIVWHYRKWPSGNKQFQHNHDCLLFYSRSESKDRVFNKVDLMERSESTLKRFGKHKIISGHDEDGKRLPSQMEDEESAGVPRDDVWDMGRIPPIKQLYPTQKPEQLLSRIIRASSNEGNIVLDPFCGCGTAVMAAQELNRQWIGIDITHLAINIIKLRLKGMFDSEPKKDYKVIGEPEDLTSAIELANQNRYQFQWWATSLINARPYGDKKKGKDTGIDGFVYFGDKEGNKNLEFKKGIVSVKSGKVSPKDIRELGHVLDRENAEIGIFITLQEPTRDMVTEAVSKGFYRSQILGKDYPRLQILTIEDLLKGIKPQIPYQISTFKKAGPNEAEQLDLTKDNE